MNHCSTIEQRVHRIGLILAQPSYDERPKGRRVIAFYKLFLSFNLPKAGQGQFLLHLTRWAHQLTLGTVSLPIKQR
jgi:hypothetical protein